MSNIGQTLSGHSLPVSTRSSSYLNPSRSLAFVRAAMLSSLSPAASSFGYLTPRKPCQVLATKPLIVKCSGKESDARRPAENKSIVSVTGATGFIGRRLVHKLMSENHKVCVLTRSREKAKLVFPADTFPGIILAEEGDWANCIRNSNSVINLAGTPISTRWSSEVCREWEARAFDVSNDVRLALIRIGIVLGKDGGALEKMIPLFLMYAGGPLGSGRQWFSWIHMDDLVNLIYEAVVNTTYKGIFNGTAPNPVRLSEMCDQLGEIMGRPSWLPVPEFALKAVLGEGATIVLEGQRVLPARAIELGFSYKYPYVRDALKAILLS